MTAIARRLACALTACTLLPLAGCLMFVRCPTPPRECCTCDLLDHMCAEVSDHGVTRSLRRLIDSPPESVSTAVKERLASLDLPTEVKTDEDGTTRVTSRTKQGQKFTVMLQPTETYQRRPLRGMEIVKKTTVWTEWEHNDEKKTDGEEMEMLDD